MNPADRAWYERIGISLTREDSPRYVYCIEPATDDAQDDVQADVQVGEVEE